MMKTILAICAALCLSSGAFAADNEADEAKPIELTAAQMDQITAGDLTLPNGRQIFVGFDNPAPGPVHPVFLNGVPSEGPWNAHFNSHMISCQDCGA